METMTPDDIDQMARGLINKTERRDSKGDLRIGAKLKEARALFGFPRSTVAEVTGVDITSITRLENGQRMFSAHSLTHILLGLRETVRLFAPTKVRLYDKWMIEMLEVVREVEEEERLRRRKNGQRPLTSQRGRR